jgi:hypothetical protein
MLRAASQSNNLRLGFPRTEAPYTVFSFSFHSWAKFCDEPQDPVLKGMPIVPYQKQQLRKAAANCVECVVNWTRNER